MENGEFGLSWLTRIFWKPKAFHVHDWRVLRRDAVGSYSKREVPGDTVYFVGTVEVCACGEQRFVPDDTKPMIVGA